MRFICLYRKNDVSKKSDLLTSYAFALREKAIWLKCKELRPQGVHVEL